MASRNTLYSVNDKYLEGILDVIDVDEMLLEDLIGSDNVEKVRGTYFSTAMYFSSFFCCSHKNQPNTHLA